MASTPQMRQQIDRPARIIDGYLTYFKTWLAAQPEEDKDERHIKAELSEAQKANAVVGGTQVRVLESRPRPGLVAGSGNKAQGTGEQNQ